MWSLNWGVFWAILAALSVRAIWVMIWGDLLGKWAPTRYRLLNDLSASLDAACEKITEASKHLDRLKGIEQASQNLDRLEQIEKGVSRLEEIEESVFHLYRLEQIEKDVSEIAIHLCTQPK
jgi:hypothetical protein